VFHDARNPRESRRQRVGVVDRAERAVEYQIPVVGHDRAVLSLGVPKRRLAVQFPNPLGDDRVGVGMDFEWDRPLEVIGQLRRICNDEKPVRRRIDEFLARVSRRRRPLDERAPWAIASGSSTT